jgi:PqqD family protein of HPr-rel-A system
VAWQLNALASLHWRCWDTEWVVFDAASGQTHQMDGLTALTLMSIEGSPLAQAELQSRVSDEMQLPNNPELSNALNEILERLAAVGLIESIGP